MDGDDDDENEDDNGEQFEGPCRGFGKNVENNGNGDCYYHANDNGFNGDGRSHLSLHTFFNVHIFCLMLIFSYFSFFYIYFVCVFLLLTPF